MKKSFSFTFLIFVACTLHAQNSGFELGIEGGPDIANVLIGAKTQSGNYKFIAEYDPEFSFSGGITALYKISDRFSIKSGLAYQQNSMNFKFADGYQNGRSPVTVIIPVMNDYLMLPLLARYSIGHHVKFFVDGGPYLGYLLKGTIQGYFYSPDYKSTINVTYSEYRVDFGASAGIGAGMKIIHNFSLELEARGNYGLINVNSLISNFNETRNESANLLLSLRYSFGSWK